MEKDIKALLASNRFWGILTRKDRWGLSGRGWLILFSATVIAGWALRATIQPFLAVTDRVDANFLVVEGWVHEYAIRAGAEEFRSGSYQRVFATGGPVTGTGGYTSDFMTAAHVGADQLRDAGVPVESVEMVASRVTGRDRTYGSAVALRDWFRNRGMVVQSINVVTESVHARRTRLLFQKAFGKAVRVGVIAVPNPDYAGEHWWRCSEGVRDVVGEWIAYVYARLFFSSDQDTQPMQSRADFNRGRICNEFKLIRGMHPKLFFTDSVENQIGNRKKYAPFKLANHSKQRKLRALPGSQIP